MTVPVEPFYAVGGTYRFRSYDHARSQGITRRNAAGELEVWDLSAGGLAWLVLVDPTNEVYENAASAETTGSDGVFIFDTVEDATAALGGLDQTGTWQVWWKASKGGVTLKTYVESIEVHAPGEQGL